MKQLLLFLAIFPLLIFGQTSSRSQEIDIVRLLEEKAGIINSLNSYKNDTLAIESVLNQDTIVFTLPIDSTYFMISRYDSTFGFHLLVASEIVIQSLDSSTFKTVSVDDSFYQSIGKYDLDDNIISFYFRNKCYRFRIIPVDPEKVQYNNSNGDLYYGEDIVLIKLIE